jgi:mannosyltransferase
MSVDLTGQAVVAPRPAPRAVSSTVWLSCILLLATAVRVYDLGGLSLWRDELFSRFYPRAGEAFMWGPGRSLEPNPPLYYSILHAWMALAGESDTAVRLPSVAASLLSVWLVYLIGRDLLSARAGLLAALMLALSASGVFYAQEARSYALEGAGIGLAMLGMVRFLQHPARWPGLALYALGVSLALYSHMTALLFVAAANLAIATALLGSRPLLDKRALLRWCGGNLVAAALCLPLATILLSPHVAGAYAWIDPLDLETVLLELSSILLGPASWQLGLWFATAAIAGFAALLARWRPDRTTLTILVLTPALFMALLLGVSVWRPMLMLRTVSWLVAPVSLVLGAALAPRSRSLMVGVAVVLSLGLIYQLHRLDTLKEDWRGFIGSLDARLGPPALVVLAPDTTPAAIAAYAPAVRTIHQVPVDEPGSVDATVIPRVLGVQPITLEAMAAAIAGGQPVWLITRSDDNEWIKRALAVLPPPKERVDPPVHGDPALAFRW